MAETARVKYVYVDVVGFTKDRHVEAQSDIISALNAITRDSVSAVQSSPETTLLLPTGDGLAVAMLNSLSYDIHLRFALELLSRVAAHNASTEDPQRRFAVRVGINENDDNVIIDVNGNRNVAGHGISMAQRIMDQADGGQILVGQVVFESLRSREQYMSSFRSYNAKGKHDVSFSVHQYVAEDVSGLDTAPPAVFTIEPAAPLQLTRIAAYYIAHAVKNREFLLSRNADPKRDYTAVALLYLHALDSDTKADTAHFDVPFLRVWNAESATFEEQYAHYLETDIQVLAIVDATVPAVHLTRFARCFETDGVMRNYAFVSTEGLERLRNEWPAIAEEFGLTNS